MNDKPKRRLSAQICRVLAIVECLQSAPSSLAEIVEYVNQVIPKPASARTIRSDVDAMIAMGYCKFIESERCRQFSIKWPIREVATVEKVVIPKRQLEKEKKFRQLVGDGRTNKDISRLLKLDPRTVASWRVKFGLPA